MFTVCPSQNDVISTMPSACNHSSQWRGLIWVLKLGS